MINKMNDRIEETIDLGHLALNVRYQLIDKPVIVFLHFSGGNMHMWDGVIEHFASDYSVVIPDLRGHGKSSRPASGYHIDDMANDVVMLLEYLKIEKCHVVGSSMGAEVAISLAARYPQRVISVVCEGALYNEFGEYGLIQGTPEEIMQKKLELNNEITQRIEHEYTTIEQFIEAERQKVNDLGIWNEHFHVFFENNVECLENEMYVTRYKNHVRMEYIRNYWDIKFEEYYKKIQCPILFLPSEEEWNDERIRSIMLSFAGFVTDYKIGHIDSSLHAYVWMQFPAKASEIASNFIHQVEAKTN